MKRFTDAGRRAIADDNSYSALSLALTMPDICGSLEDPGPGKSKKRYEKWCERWFIAKFTHEGMIFVSAAECYQLRCSLMHSGQSEIQSGGVPFKFEFYNRETGSHMLRFDNCEFDGVRGDFVGLKADKFSESVFDAADEWDAAMSGSPAVQAEKAKLLRIRLKGEGPRAGMAIR